jgi:hypothetical protein
MSVFETDPELQELLMGLDDQEPIYLTPDLTPAPPAPNLITDDADSNFKAGRMLDQDASKSNTPNTENNEQIISDDELDEEDLEANEQRLAVEKTIKKEHDWKEKCAS